MKCPFCGHEDTQVKDSRPYDDGAGIRRRRHCTNCDERFNTLERVQLRELTVIKRDGTKRPFDRDKIMRSLTIALRKRPVESDRIEQAVAAIVKKLELKVEPEIASEAIGQEVMNTLQSLDPVGYIRYASVYRDFREAGDFEEFMRGLQQQKS
jgi:transcriptional repressor NrdR